jgi:phosphoribosyl-dephospho-CoA transferase
VPLAARWVDHGWPLVARRPLPGEEDGVPLGLPLPPAHGKRRLLVLVQWADIVAVAPPRRLADCRAVAPAAWQDAIGRILELPGLREEVRCFGSLAWARLTGLNFIASSSDLDLLLAPRNMGDATALSESLAAIERDAPMRLDGEILRPDGAAANWREVHGGAADLLVKSREAAALWTRARFLGEAP